jgi:hypothetical protein
LAAHNVIANMAVTPQTHNRSRLANLLIDRLVARPNPLRCE